MRLFTFGLLTLLTAIPSAAAAPPQICEERTKLAALLIHQYGEALAGSGIGSNGILLELYANADYSTWTMVQQQPNGMACVVAAGRNWEVERVMEGSPA